MDFIPGGGFDMQIGGVGPNYSQTRIMVGLDLSLTDTRSSKVVANVSLQKQIAAQDYGINAGRFAGHTLLNIQIGKGEREATNFALRQMLNLATFELLSQVIPPATFESCRAAIPPEFGRLDLTRSSVALYKYKESQQQNTAGSVETPLESSSDKTSSSNEKNKSKNSPNKDTQPHKNKESDLIKNPEGDSEMSKKDLIKYISMKQHSSSSKVNEGKKEDEKAQMLWDVNPAMIENYWSTTQRD